MLCLRRMNLVQVTGLHTDCHWSNWAAEPAGDYDPIPCTAGILNIL
jgi:hypothetical protein